MEDRGGADRVMIAGTHGCRPEWEGRTVAELAEELKLSPADTVVHALTAAAAGWPASTSPSMRATCSTS